MVNDENRRSAEPSQVEVACVRRVTAPLCGNCRYHVAVMLMRKPPFAGSVCCFRRVADGNMQKWKKKRGFTQTLSRHWVLGARWGVHCTRHRWRHSQKLV